MEPLLRALLKIPEVAEAAAGLAGGHGPVAMTGLSPIHRAQVAAALALETGRPLVMVCAEEGEAARLAGDLQALTAVPLRDGAVHPAGGGNLPGVGAPAHRRPV